MARARSVGNPTVTWATIVIIAFALALPRNAAGQDALSDRTVIVSRGQWKIPLETVRCLSRASTKKTMILGNDYSDDSEMIVLFGKSFGGLPTKVDDPNCTYVYFVAASTYDRAVRLQGHPAVILASVGLCEWETPQKINPDQCSQKNVWFFQEKIRPLELVTISFKAFVEPQDRDWKVFHSYQGKEEREPCTSANTKSIFFQPESVPADEPLVIKTTIVNLIRPEDWSHAKVHAAQPESSRYAVGHVDKVLKGRIWGDATALFINASVGKCVHPLKVGDTGILVGSANEVSDGIVRFFPRLNIGN